MKISIIGAGNVGSLTALRLLESNLGEIALIDIAAGLAKAKSLDLEDARSLRKIHYTIEGSDDLSKIKGSDIVVVTAGLSRRPGMTREDLLVKNAEIIKGLCLRIKELAADSIIVMVTNPLDIMTYLALKISGFCRNRVFGMGISLDASRYANLISKELNIPIQKIVPCVIGAHGEGMLPLARLTKVNGRPLERVLPQEKISELVKMTVSRGAQIVSLFGSGSAYFAPSAAIAELVKCIAANQKRTIGLSVCLEGEYGISGVCLGLPCIVGRKGIKRILQPALNKEESGMLEQTAESIRKNLELLRPFIPG